MQISKPTYISNEDGDRIAVIVPIELWQKLTDADDVDATAELISISGFESAFETANQQVKEGKTKNWRAIANDV